MKPALMAPLGFVALCTLGVVSGALAAPRHFVAVSAYVTDSDVTASESASDGNTRAMLGFTRSAAPVALLPKQWLCGDVEASAVGGSYRRCEVQ